MTDYISSNSMLMLERAMNFQWTKQETLLDNIVIPPAGGSPR